MINTEGQNGHKAFLPYKFLTALSGVSMTADRSLIHIFKPLQLVRKFLSNEIKENFPNSSQDALWQQYFGKGLEFWQNAPLGQEYAVVFLYC